MKKLIGLSLLSLLTALAATATAGATTLTIYPEKLVMTAKSVAPGNFVSQDPGGVFALLADGSDPVRFWAPVPLAVGRFVRGIAYDFNSAGQTVLRLYRVKNASPELIDSITSPSSHLSWDKGSHLLKPAHRIASGYRYFVEVELNNDCIVGNVYITY